jgi:hypothetical protein
MPRAIYAPILNRTLLYERLRDGTIHLLDFQIVGTSLGTMIEPRCLTRQTGAVANSDPYENGYDDIREVNKDSMFSSLGFGGSQWPRNWNTQ